MTAESTSYRAEFVVDRTPDVAFDTIAEVRSWWTGDIVGESGRVGDVFTYRHEDLHVSTQRVTDLEPGRRVVWHVDDARLSFVADPTEWIGTDIVFELEPVGEGTRVTFTHVGLDPRIECYEACSSAWGYYVTERLPEVILARPRRNG
jgi:hypothetical protein